MVGSIPYPTLPYPLPYSLATVPSILYPTFYPILSYPTLYPTVYPTLPYPTLSSTLTLPYPSISSTLPFTLPYTSLPLPYPLPTLPYSTITSTLPYPTLPYHNLYPFLYPSLFPILSPSLPYPTLPCLTLSYPILPYHTLPPRRLSTLIKLKEIHGSSPQIGVQGQQIRIQRYPYFNIQDILGPSQFHGSMCFGMKPLGFSYYCNRPSHSGLEVNCRNCCGTRQPELHEYYINRLSFTKRLLTNH